MVTCPSECVKGQLIYCQFFLWKKEHMWLGCCERFFKPKFWKKCLPSALERVQSKSDKWNSAGPKFAVWLCREVSALESVRLERVDCIGAWKRHEFWPSNTDGCFRSQGVLRLNPKGPLYPFIGLILSMNRSWPPTCETECPDKKKHMINKMTQVNFHLHYNMLDHFHGYLHPPSCDTPGMSPSFLYQRIYPSVCPI